MIKFNVTNRFTGNIKFTAEIDCAEDAPLSIKLGLAAPEMRDALTPFAEHAKERCVDAPEWRDGDTVSITVRIEDLRAVSAALAKADGSAS